MVAGWRRQAGRQAVQLGRAGLVGEWVGTAPHLVEVRGRVLPVVLKTMPHEETLKVVTGVV